MIGKRILKNHTPVNLSCHHQRIIFMDFYSIEHAGKNTYIYLEESIWFGGYFN